MFFKENNVENIAPSTLWETHKVFVRGRLIAEGAKRRKIWLAEKKLILQEIQKLEQTHKEIIDSKIMEEVTGKRGLLKNLIEQETKSVLENV